jgi:hypothetical protein
VKGEGLALERGIVADLAAARMLSAPAMEPMRELRARSAHARTIAQIALREFRDDCTRTAKACKNRANEVGTLLA